MERHEKEIACGYRVQALRSIGQGSVDGAHCSRPIKTQNADTIVFFVDRTLTVVRSDTATLQSVKLVYCGETVIDRLFRPGEQYDLASKSPSSLPHFVRLREQNKSLHYRSYPFNSRTYTSYPLLVLTIDTNDLQEKNFLSYVLR